MPEAFPALVLALVLAVTTVALGVWAPRSERRPRHAGAGPGALTVQQLREQVERSEDAAATGELPALGRGRWSHWRGTLPLSAVAKRRPGSSTLPGRHTEPSPDLSLSPDRALLARVLARLRAL
ncbi:hypothetical protein [Actinopolyspora mortivallis]|uniref:hypothetical protein n=1 Tax=Actinopolyspora mortivallis TaxID=33906 RepID=UPI00037D6264|nr:hypothetical protein [Actinopolyspora mortivallis]